MFDALRTPRLEPIVQLGSSLRGRDPIRTLEIARPLMSKLGISRVTDVTAMDMLGLPVCISIRPRSRTLHVHAGKGLRPIEARIGALMEAIEYAVAEPQHSEWKPHTLRVGELEAAWGGAFDLRDLAPRYDYVHDTDIRFETVRCEELVSGLPAHMPADLVFLPFESPERPGLLRWTSNGLASGNSASEATLHALLEVLERDAEAMDLARSESRWIDIAELPEPFPALAESWLSRGVALAVRYLPNAFGLPCFEAVLSAPADSNVKLAAGYGLHLSRDVAVSRAICEAAQSRLTNVHGGRDDIVPYFDHVEVRERAERTGAEHGTIAEKFDRSRPMQFNATPELPCAGRSMENLLDELLLRLKGLGFDRVYRHRFKAPLNGLHVVKVIVPRCENSGHPCAHMGRRLFARVIADA